MFRPFYEIILGNVEITLDISLLRVILEVGSLCLAYICSKHINQREDLYVIYNGMD